MWLFVGIVTFIVCITIVCLIIDMLDTNGINILGEGNVDYE